MKTSRVLDQTTRTFADESITLPDGHFGEYSSLQSADLDLGDTRAIVKGLLSYGDVSMLSFINSILIRVSWSMQLPSA